jgi:hypothetical protein
MFKSKALLSMSSDAKTVKGETLGFLTGILYLAPYNTTKWNTCSMAGIAECWKGCLFSAGRGAMSTVAQGRINKTIWFFEERNTFMQQLVVDVKRVIRKAKRKGLVPLIRLNGTSDIRWETVGFIDADGTEYVNIFAAFPDVTFYDYTKDVNRKDLPANYDLTFSYSSAPKFQPMVRDAIAQGMRIAVVFRTIADIPMEFLGMPVVGGDNSDVRHIDPTGVVVALYAKGKGIKDKGYLVVDQYTKIIPIRLAA